MGEVVVHEGYLWAAAVTFIMMGIVTTITRYQYHRQQRDIRRLLDKPKPK